MAQEIQITPTSDPTAEAQDAAVGGLLERLERLVPPTGFGSTRSYPRNPDGPEAASVIRSLTAEREQLTDQCLAHGSKATHEGIRAAKAEARAERAEAERDALMEARQADVKVMEAVLSWANARCPCGPPDYEMDEPKICPLCLADRDDVVNGFCKAAESTVPPHILSDLRRAALDMQGEGS